mgnify:CR=1 FL=1|tara:strand:- start:817 stop:957 length:141 start_codon:yes stop_codon:yes gene_type:complete
MSRLAAALAVVLLLVATPVSAQQGFVCVETDDDMLKQSLEPELIGE